MLCSMTESTGNKASTPGAFCWWAFCSWPLCSWRSPARCRPSSCALLRLASRPPRSCARPAGGAMARRTITAISERKIRSIITPAQAPTTARLFQLDCAVDLDRKPDRADRQHYLCRQRLVPFELAVGKRGADGLLDFALRGNADLLEKFAYAHIECFFIHDRFSKTPERWRRRVSLSDLFYRSCGRNDACGRSGRQHRQDR